MKGAHRREIGTREGTRRLGCCTQALFALAWFSGQTRYPAAWPGFRAGAVADKLTRPTTLPICDTRAEGWLAR